MHILYLTFDLCDAATWRRVTMLERGGARVTIAGFHRGAPPTGGGDRTVIPLGQTHNGRFSQRVLAILKARFSVAKQLSGIDQPDVILARNLETLALAPRLRRLFPSVQSVVYECLDIHRLQVGNSAVSGLIRTVERQLLGHTDLIITSSPAFTRNYFASVLNTTVPVEIVENKCEAVSKSKSKPSMSGRFRIGWFGVLRCRASLVCLDELTRRHPGVFRVILRGRPALDAISDFHAIITANSDISFEGAYKPNDLPKIYSETHFSWCIDQYEAGANSEWLLPNRIYEGTYHGAVPIALKGTETARFLMNKGLGIVISDVRPGALASVINMTFEDILEHRAKILSAPSSYWAYTQKDCTRLVEKIARAGSHRAGANTTLRTEAVS